MKAKTDPSAKRRINRSLQLPIKRRWRRINRRVKIARAAINRRWRRSALRAKIPAAYIKLKEWLKKGVDLIGAAPKIIGGLAVIILSILLIYNSYLEVNAENVQILPFGVPPDLEKNGLSSEVIAGKVADRVNSMIRIARSSSSASLKFKTSNSEILTPDVTVPSTNISLKSLISYFRPRSPSVGGEIIKDGKATRITIRVQNKDQKDNQNETFTVPDENWDALLDKAAEYIFRITSPYVFASYLYEKDRLSEALESARYCAYNLPTTDDARGYILWGLILHKQNKDIQAIEKYKLAVEKDPKMYYAYINWGRILEIQGDFEQAKEKYKKAVDINSEASLVYNNLGIISKREKDNDSAINYFKKAIQVDPTDTLPFENLGKLFLSDGKYEEAADVYEQAIAFNREKSDYIYLRWGSALREMGDYDNAIKKYQWIIKKDADAGGCNSAAYNSWGFALQERGEKTGGDDYSEAISKYKKSIGCNDQNAGAYENWREIIQKMSGADKLRELEQFKLAVSQFQRSVDISSRKNSGYGELARSLLVVSKFAEAVEYHEKGAFDEPDSCTYRYKFAVALEEHRQFDLARTQYQKMLSIKPACGIAYDAQQALERLTNGGKKKPN